MRAPDPAEALRQLLGNQQRARPPQDVEPHERAESETTGLRTAP
jgi:hypothetical protein